MHQGIDDADKRLGQVPNDEMNDPDGHCEREQRHEAGQKILLHELMMSRDPLFRKLDRFLSIHK